MMTQPATHEGPRTFQRIVVLDDHPLYRDALTSAIERVFPGVEIEPSGRMSDFLGKLKAGFTPDLVVLDLVLPDVCGLSGFDQVQAALGDCPILVISAQATPETVQKLMQKGAAGYMPKDGSAEQFAEILTTIAAGRSFQPKEIMHLWDIQEGAAGSDWSHPMLAALPKQQRRVLELICEGKPNKQIAYELDLALATVKAHITALLRRLEVNNRTQAVVLVESLQREGLGQH